MTQDEIQAEIAEKRQLLAQSDHETIKGVEAFFLAAEEATTIAGLIKAIRSSVGDFAELFERRQSWRARIGELQATEPDGAEPAAADDEAQ